MKLAAAVIAATLVACSSTSKPAAAPVPIVAVAVDLQPTPEEIAATMATNGTPLDAECTAASALAADSCAKGLYCARGMGCKHNLDLCRPEGERAANELADREWRKMAFGEN
jgi:hypothetical protein